MFTLGNGDLAPNGGLWKLVTIIETAQGLLTITFSVTYLISVLSAVNQKRSFAQSVLSLGHDGTEIVHNAWNGKDFHDIDFLLVAASSELGKLTAQHNAFPILHFYHSTQHQESSIIAVAVLDEALTIFKYGIPEQYQPNQLHIKEARSSIKNYLDTVHTAYIHPAEQAPSTRHLKASTIRHTGFIKANISNCRQFNKGTSSIAAGNYPSGCSKMACSGASNR